MRAVVSFLRRNPSNQLRAPCCPIRTVFHSPHVARIASLHHEPLHVQRALTCQPRLYHTDSKEPTIYALSTASGRAAIAVIRASGPACRQVCTLHPMIDFPSLRFVDIRRAMSLYSVSEASSGNPAQAIYPTCPPFARNDTRLRYPRTLLSRAQYRDRRRRARTARAWRPGYRTRSTVSHT